MKSLRFSNIYFIAFTLLSIVTFTSCGEENETPPANGNLAILLDNMIDGNSINLKDSGDDSYQHTDEDGQEYNISLYAYYITGIELEGPNETKFINPSSVTATEVEGYYHVTSTTAGSNVINIGDITAGTYDKIKFTIGVGEDGVSQGAAGGVLDPANGAWFWNWNAGYIGFGVEGNASNSGQEYVDWGNGFETIEGTFAVHIGGWKDVEPEEGEDPKFVNNLRTIELDFDSAINIEEGLNPEAHINVDFAKLLQGNDFGTTYAVHRPDLGSPFADLLSNVFELDHVHQ